MNLSGKTVLITGSSSGIGEATSYAFAKEGAKVIVNYLSNREGAERVVLKIREMGCEAIGIKADVSDPGEVKSLFREAVKAFGTVDILINNAGGAHEKPFLETTKDDWINEFNINFFGAVLCSQEAIRVMLNNEDGGKILNTSSVRGLPDDGREGTMAYCAAKAAVINFTKNLAKAYCPKILVNSVAPGFTQTPYFDRLTDEQKNERLRTTPINRFIQPSEIADAFLYLAKSDCLTGEILVVDGGYSLKI
jgi:3-oxoacyl-[acyl-carrier protein] reductase